MKKQNYIQIYLFWYKLQTFIRSLEAEAGTDINCVVMTTEEFNYRYDMYDRFIRDLLNDKCEFLINKLDL